MRSSSEGTSESSTLVEGDWYCDLCCWHNAVFGRMGAVALLDADLFEGPSFCLSLNIQASLSI